MREWSDLHQLQAILVAAIRGGAARQGGRRRVLALRKGIEADVLLLSKLPSKYAFIYEDHGIRHFGLESWVPRWQGYDAFLC